MNIYIGHSNNFDFKAELYTPIRKSKLNKHHHIVFPHEDSLEPFNSEEYLKSCDLMIAEVSYPSTGLGIELGWAHIYKTPILAIHKNGTKLGGSIKVVTDDIINYSNPNDMIKKLRDFID